MVRKKRKSRRKSRRKHIKTRKRRGGGGEDSTSKKSIDKRIALWKKTISGLTVKTLNELYNDERMSFIKQIMKLKFPKTDIDEFFRGVTPKQLEKAKEFLRPLKGMSGGGQIGGDLLVDLGRALVDLLYMILGSQGLVGSIFGLFWLLFLILGPFAVLLFFSMLFPGRDGWRGGGGATTGVTRGNWRN